MALHTYKKLLRPERSDEEKTNRKQWINNEANANRFDRMLIGDFAKCNDKKKHHDQIGFK